MTKKTRRSPEELAAHHKALALKHEAKARYAKDPSLKSINGMIDELSDICEADARFANETMQGMHQTAIEALCHLHDALIG